MDRSLCLFCGQLAQWLNLSSPVRYRMIGPRQASVKPAFTGNTGNKLKPAPLAILIREPSPAIKLEIRICHVNFLIRKFGNSLKFPNSEITNSTNNTPPPQYTSASKPFNKLLVYSTRVMFIIKSYSPNSGRFKRPVAEEATNKGGVQSKKRASSHTKAQEKHSGTQEGSIRDHQHLPPRSSGLPLGLYSPIQLPDDNADVIDDDNEHPFTRPVSRPSGSPALPVEELNASGDKEDVQHPVSPPTAPTRHRWALPFPRRRYPTDTVWEPYEERKSVLLQASENDDDSEDSEWDDHGIYYDDPEFTGFGAGRIQISESDDMIPKDIEKQFPSRIQFPGFQSAKYMIQNKNYEDDNGRYSQDDDDDDDIYDAPVHRAPSASLIIDHISNPDLLNSDIDDGNEDSEESSHIPKKKGPRVDDRFPLASLGDLEHPYIGWIIDKVTMDEYMPNYAKQEGVALTRTKDGMRVRYQCVHAGRYRNRNNLPAEVTEKKRRQELQDAGIIPFV